MDVYNLVSYKIVTKISVRPNTGSGSEFPYSNAPHLEPYLFVSASEPSPVSYAKTVHRITPPYLHSLIRLFSPQITETYAFLPREAVTRFLTGCAECARRPRSASPPPLPTPSPSPTRHPYHPFLPHCPDYSRNWENEIDAAQNYTYENYEPLKKVDSPKHQEEDPEPTYIELTTKKYDANLYTSPVEPFREEEPVRTDPEIDKDENSLIDVEDVKADSPVPQSPQTPPKKEVESVQIKGEVVSSTRAPERAGVKEIKTEPKKKYNPLDVANLTSKDPPKSRSPPRKKLLPSSIEYPNTFESYLKPWRPDGEVYRGEEMDYSVPITTAYLKHMRSLAFQDRLDAKNNKVSGT